MAASFLAAFLLTWASDDAAAAAAGFWEFEDDIILAWECGFCEDVYSRPRCVELRIFARTTWIVYSRASSFCKRKRKRRRKGSKEAQETRLKEALASLGISN